MKMRPFALQTTLCFLLVCSGESQHFHLEPKDSFPIPERKNVAVFDQLLSSQNANFPVELCMDDAVVGPWEASPVNEGSIYSGEQDIIDDDQFFHDDESKEVAPETNNNVGPFLLMIVVVVVGFWFNSLQNFPLKSNSLVERKNFTEKQKKSRDNSIGSFLMIVIIGLFFFVNVQKSRAHLVWSFLVMVMILVGFWCLIEAQFTKMEQNNLEEFSAEEQKFTDKEKQLREEFSAEKQTFDEKEQLLLAELTAQKRKVAIFEEETVLNTISRVINQPIQKLHSMDKEQLLTLETLVLNYTTKVHEIRNELISDQNSCCVCLKEKKAIIFLPCKHVCTCNECSNKLLRVDNKCPLCQIRIEQRIEPYL